MLKLKYTLGKQFLLLLSFVTLIIFFTDKIDAFAQEDKFVRGVIDIHSNISDGRYSQERIAKLAQEKGLSVLIFGDSALRKWEYGIWPLRNIIKKTYQESSVLHLGTRRYLERFTVLKNEFPDLVLIPGLEVTPFFYWEGSPFSKNFALINYYKQFLVIGLSSEDYQNMPIVGNRRFLSLFKNILFGLWPILLIIVGVKIIRKRFLGISLMVIGVIFLINNLPFPTSRFNIYQGYQGIEPYQDLIDYVNKKGGLIFWAHPEMLSQKGYFGVEIYTSVHLEELLLTHDYTGFGVSLSNMLEITEPANIWDKILLEYITNKRKRPVWIIGTSHYTGEAVGIDYLENLFFVKELREEDVLDALRQGRMYVRFNLKEKPAVLKEFMAKNIGSGSIQIIIKGNSPSLEPVKIELIRNGKTFRTFEGTDEEWEIIVEDNLSRQENKAYYRLKVSNSSSIILSNPVFVEM